jgi:RND superfamily putative drug exporter
MTGPLYRFGGLMARRAPWVIVAWLVAMLVIILVANATGRPTSNNTTIPGSDSEKATELLQKKLPAQANGSVPIVLEASKGTTLTDATNVTAINDAVESLSKNSNVANAVSPLMEGSKALSADATIGFISLTLTESSDDLDEDEAKTVLADADTARRQGDIKVSAGGYLGTQLSTPGTRASEVVGIVAAMIVLLFALGTLTAMTMPITTAIVGVFGGLAVIGALGTGFQVPTISPTVAAMLGLGVGVDYSLFITTRHMRLLRDGHEVKEAVARSIATSGGAVAFAGGTVIIALLCLFFGGIPIVTELGYSTAIAVAVVILTALVLLPAMLSLLGHRILSVPIPGSTTPGEEGDDHGFARLAGFVGRHSILSSVAGVLILVVLAIPLFGISLGAQDNGQLSESTTLRKAYDGLATGFGVGVNGPLQVAVDVKPAAADPSDPTSDPTLVGLQQAIMGTKDVSAVTAATLSDDGTAAVFAAIPNSSPSANKTRNLVNKLRDDVIPGVLDGSESKAFVGGTTAANIDLATKIGQKLPIVILIIVFLSVLLLAVAFRTIVVPLVGAVINLLAVAASYGVLTQVFENGWFVKVIGLDGELPVVSFVPLLMFAILFGLSMDYTVFLLTRVRERYDATGDHRKSVIEGLSLAGRVISAAALIMILVFASFILNGDPTVKQFGVGLAVAVAAAGTGVMFVLPALMLLIGNACWWLPGPVERHLPQIGIEGEAYFERLDAAKGAKAARAKKGA